MYGGFHHSARRVFPGTGVDGLVVEKYTQLMVAKIKRRKLCGNKMDRRTVLVAQLDEIVHLGHRFRGGWWAGRIRKNNVTMEGGR